MEDIYLTVHKPAKGWSIQLIEFDDELNELMPSQWYPNGDILEYACKSEDDAIEEGLSISCDLELPFIYTSTKGVEIKC